MLIMLRVPCQHQGSFKNIGPSVWTFFFNCTVPKKIQLRMSLNLCQPASRPSPKPAALAFRNKRPGQKLPSSWAKHMAWLSLAFFASCYDFGQLKQLFNSHVSQRGHFQCKGLRFEMRKALFIGKQRLATG